jgi:two-component system, NtrC family, response regulator AtoC
MTKQKILVVDDEKGIRESLTIILEMEGFEVKSAPDTDRALELVQQSKRFDFIICDIRLPGRNGIGFLKEIREMGVSSVVIMISAYGTIETSIEAIKTGADDYINKPINPEELILRMRMAKERKELQIENMNLKKELGFMGELKQIVYSSDVMKGVLELSMKAAQFKTTVLITGESGTGKELIAKTVHNNSKRKDSPFVAVNCAAIPETLMESELFGYVKGAFSGASTDKTGLIEEAAEGTLFLDEIGEIPLSLQPKLLRVLQEQEIRRLGDTKTKNVDLRVIAATSLDIVQAAKEGSFREDLFYRLNVFPIHIPPLRERKDEIPLLVSHFITKYNQKLSRSVKDVAPEVMAGMMQHEWSGNIRELENVIERAMILSDTDYIANIDLMNGDKKDNNKIDTWLSSLSFEEAKQKIERKYIERALTETGGNRTRAAKILGISRRSLIYKLKEYQEH